MINNFIILLVKPEAQLKMFVQLLHIEVNFSQIFGDDHLRSKFEEKRIGSLWHFGGVTEAEVVLVFLLKMTVNILDKVSLPGC